MSIEKELEKLRKILLAFADQSEEIQTDGVDALTEVKRHFDKRMDQLVVHLAALERKMDTVQVTADKTDAGIQELTDGVRNAVEWLQEHPEYIDKSLREIAADAPFGRSIAGEAKNVLRLMKRPGDNEPEDNAA